MSKGVKGIRCSVDSHKACLFGIPMHISCLSGYVSDYYSNKEFQVHIRRNLK